MRIAIALAGFTALTLATLRHQVIWFDADGSLRHIGSAAGASAQIVERCLKRMMAWVALVVKVIDTEFPSFDVMGSFMVLDLNSDDLPTQDP